MPRNPLIAPETPVAVRTRYDGSWAEGFEVAAVRSEEADPYVVRRTSDSAVLPAQFSTDDIRPTR